MNKIIFLLNNIFALALLLSFITPYIKPSSISISPLLSLATPLLIIVNVIFLIYWIVIGFKKQFILSLVVLIIGLFVSSSIYKFGSNSDKSDKELSIMTYNVRKFNVYEWLEDKDISTKINTFIKKENPDVLVIQEFKEDENFNINYPYKYNPIIWKTTRSGLAVFSKYPIINSGIVKKNRIASKAIYTDIIKNNDTIRIYNYHLSSLGVIPDEEFFGHKDSEKLLKRLSISFKFQEKEIETLINHIQKCNYKIIVVGDMNNTAYSWAYKNLKGNLKDSFLEAGNGFGKTYSFRRFPLRIDFIFTDETIEIINHKNYNEGYSDHYPIMATLEL